MYSEIIKAMKSQRICFCWFALCSYLLTVECQFFPKGLVACFLAVTIFGQRYYRQNGYHQPVYNHDYGNQPYRQGYRGQSSYGQPLFNNNYGNQPHRQGYHGQSSYDQPLYTNNYGNQPHRQGYHGQSSYDQPLYTNNYGNQPHRQGYHGQSSYDQPLYNNKHSYQPHNNGVQSNNNVQANNAQRKILLNNRQTELVNAVTPESFNETERRNNAHTIQYNADVSRQNSRNHLDDRVISDEKRNTELIKSLFEITSPPPVSAKRPAHSVKDPTAKTVPVAKISSDVITFGLQLMRNVDTGGNMVIGTSSIAATLVLLQQGARGETQFQISIALDSGIETVASYRQLVAIFNARKCKNVLKLASGIFMASNSTLNPQFRKLATQNFLAEIISVDFNRPEFAVQQINRWIDDRTEHNIKELVKPDSVTYHTQMVLAFAVYFKGVWQTKFNPKSTIPMDFHLSSGQIKKTQFMRLNTNFKAGMDEDIGAQFVIIPFDCDHYSFVALLPTPEIDLNTLLKRLDSKRLKEYHNTEPKQVKLSIPKFNISSYTNLRPVLSKMGITNIFDHHSDLSGLVAPGQIPPRVSAAMHTALLSIDEEGSTVATGTAFGAVALSSGDDTEYFRADRPFLGLWWDNDIKTILFLARIEDPTSMT